MSGEERVQDELRDAMQARNEALRIQTRFAVTYRQMTDAELRATRLSWRGVPLPRWVFLFIGRPWVRHESGSSAPAEQVPPGAVLREDT